MKSFITLLAMLFSTFAWAQTSPNFVAYKLQFGKANGQGTSNRSEQELAAIENGRLSIVQALGDQVLQTVRLKYTDEADLFICFESAKIGYGTAVRNAQKARELFEKLSKLKPEVAIQVESCSE